MLQHELYRLINEREWTRFLGELPLGESIFTFPDKKHIASCKAVAYDINSDKTGRTYTFNVNKGNMTVRINVK